MLKVDILTLFPELIKPASRLEPLYQEAREVCAIITASAKTAKARLNE